VKTQYLSGELLKHVVGMDLIALLEVPLCPALLLLLVDQT
jgi:hypothetical protein